MSAIGSGAENSIPFIAAIGLTETETEYSQYAKRLVYDNPYIKAVLHEECNGHYGNILLIDKIGCHVTPETLSILDAIRAQTGKTVVCQGDLNRWIHEQFKNEPD